MKQNEYVPFRICFYINFLCYILLQHCTLRHISVIYFEYGFSKCTLTNDIVIYIESCLHPITALYFQTEEHIYIPVNLKMWNFVKWCENK